MKAASIEPATKDVIYAAAGAGPLLQRDYGAILVGGTHAHRRAWRSSSENNSRNSGRRRPPPSSTRVAWARRLEVGDEMGIRIGGFLPCRVRVVHVDDLSLTLRTLSGHPEAGRISFKAGRDDGGRLTFQIRSRARSGGLIHYLGFLLLGRTMQARCWSVHQPGCRGVRGRVGGADPRQDVAGGTRAGRLRRARLPHVRSRIPGGGLIEWR